MIWTDYNQNIDVENLNRKISNPALSSVKSDSSFSQIR